MRILVFAHDTAWDELISGTTGIDWIRADLNTLFVYRDDIDAYFNLIEMKHETDYIVLKKPVFINSVNYTLQESGAAENVIRINGWAGFLKRSSWEVAGKLNDNSLHILKAINKKIIIVPDEPGFISARIIAMIINEAYFAKDENVSTEKEIDTAMKLGTNYPFGPFEWAQIIGIKNIYTLLKTLSKTDSRYEPSPLLETESMKIQ